MRTRKKFKSLVSKYNLYNLKLMACLSNANSHVGIWDWYYTGLHLSDVNSESQICLVDFPEYRAFLKKITKQHFKTKETQKDAFGSQKYLVSYNINEIQATFDTALQNNDINVATFNKIRHFTEQSAKNYLTLLMRAQKYAAMHTEYKENILKSTILKQFFEEYQPLFAAKKDEDIPSVAKLIKEINSDFGTSLNYRVYESDKISVNTLCSRLNKCIKTKIKCAVERAMLFK